MQTLKEIKKRVTSVKNTQKITNAMKLVASAKFNKANKAVRGARPYSSELSRLMSQLVGGDVEHPLLTAHDATTQVLVVLFSTDRGLCGALNVNLFKHVRAELGQRFGEDFATRVDFIALGKKAEQFCRKNNFNLVQVEHRVEHLDQATWPLAFSKQLSTHFRHKKYAGIYLSYQLFISALQQRPLCKQILPIGDDAAAEDASEEVSNDTALFLIEPQREAVVEQLLLRYAANQIFRAILNSVASEHRARMNAMDSATNNAKKVVKELTLQYNRGRQAAITKELIEITAGVQAI